MKLELWTDIICPWCGLGKKRLETALARFAHNDNVELVFRSFQLDERMPQGEVIPTRTLLVEKKGIAEAQLDGMLAQITSLAAQEGLSPYHLADNMVGNTSLAHELAAWATSIGRGKEVWDALYVHYFAEAKSIFDVDSLVALAQNLGLDEAAARDALESRRFQAQVLAEGREGRSLGARGVPFLVIDRQYSVAGSQSVDLFLRALETAWKEQTHTATQGESCVAEGCV